MKVGELKQIIKNIDDNIEVTATADLLRFGQSVEEISLDFKVTSADVFYYNSREILDLGLEEVK